MRTTMYGIQSILLSSLIWRKAANHELFFFIIGVSGLDYQSKKHVCVMACVNMGAQVGGHCECMCMCVFVCVWRN